MRTPDFNNLLKVLDRQAPDRPTLFEFFLNNPLYFKLAGAADPGETDILGWGRILLKAFARAGYDYATVSASSMVFPTKDVEKKASRSVNDTSMIHDRESFEAYPWPDPDAFDESHLQVLGAELPEGMKIVTPGPGGVLENAMWVVGYETLCLILSDDPGLASDIFGAIGSRLVRYYERAARHSCVGALISNDDWGFNTQTMLSPADMRAYVFPWHRRIVQTIHDAGKPAILHSCGNLKDVMDDLIDDMGYDGKHSYEDKILPVEQAYEEYGSRIAVLGGIDVDFVCRSTPEQVKARAAAMLERSAMRGSYALGTGNSVPWYVPEANYFAMIEPAVGDVTP